MAFDPYNVWRESIDPRFNRFAKRAPDYLTREQALRFERISQARLLYLGAHYDYYVRQRRTAWEFPEVVVDGERRHRYITYNLLKRISHSSADLLFGGEPLIRVADEVAQLKLKAFADRADLHARMVNMEIECSLAGEAVLEVCVLDDEVYVLVVPAEQIHPIGRLRPDGQYAAYVRYAEAERAGQTLILQTIYREGSIERRLFQGEVVDRNQINLDQWPDFQAGRVPPEVEPTGIDVNTIIWMPNLLMGDLPLSDYDGLLDLQDTLNAKKTKMDGVIDRHSHPKIVAPRAAADDKGDLRASSDVLYADDPNEWRYLTWEAQLDAAEKGLQSTEDMMCVVSETSPVLLGLDRGGKPESARAMKLLASASVAKAARKATLRRPLLVWMLRVVQELEQTIRGNRYEVGTDVSVEMRDGLPVDEKEMADTIAMARAANAMSIERAVEMQIPDRAAAAQEIERIKAERAAATPSLLVGEEVNPSADAASTEAA